MGVFRICNFLAVLLSTLYLVSCSNDNIEEVDCAISGPSIEISNITEAGCQPTGSVTVSASDGNGELLFSIDGINFQSSPTFSDLSSGSYSIIVVDASGCMEGVNAAVGNDGTDLSFTTETSVGGCGAGEGSIAIEASGGAGDYTYRLGTGVFGESNTFENVSGGFHNVTVKDAEGCITSKTITVLSGVSFQTQVKPLMDTNCSIVLCHGNDATIPTWNNYLDIKGRVSTIRSSVIGKTMPPDNPLSQDQIDLIVCWIDDGAPNN